MAEQEKNPADFTGNDKKQSNAETAETGFPNSVKATGENLDHQDRKGFVGRMGPGPWGKW
ncbi:MAG: hypothetical protein WC619_02180 [Patescibacteria group bacterium]